MNDKKLQINKKVKGLTRDELEKLNKGELIDKIVQLEAHNFQLRNLLQKKLSANERISEDVLQEHDHVSHGDKTKKTKSRVFDFSKAHKRHVLLKVMYFGWDYQGLACQEDTNDTIEHHLFNALTRTCLIESRSTSNYHRCGRTDKGVSAYCQVISIDLRSKYPEDEQLNPIALASEIDYCGLLNRVLPKSIQCVAWMPLRNREYSARFDCCSRTYRYYFPSADLNIDAMNKACEFLVVHGDFRNFCKMDVNNGVTNYMRNVVQAKVKLCPSESNSDRNGYAMYYLEIKANAFLWHQIRCIMAVLLLIGQGNEEPDVIKELLDIDKNPCKPQYMPANGLPLNLYDCEFRKVAQNPENADETKLWEGTDSTADCHEIADTTEWIYSEQNLGKLIETTQNLWTEFNVKSTMIRDVLNSLEEVWSTNFHPSIVKSQISALQNAVKAKQYQKLLTRKRCESLENRIEHYVKKQRLVVLNDNNTSERRELET